MRMCLGLQQRLRHQQVGRGMRLPRRGVMLADPGFLIAELVEPAQHLEIPVVPLLQAPLRRMRGHREISNFHGGFLSFVLLCRRVVACAPGLTIARNRAAIMGGAAAEMWRRAQPPSGRHRKARRQRDALLAPRPCATVGAVGDDSVHAHLDQARAISGVGSRSRPRPSDPSVGIRKSARRLRSRR